MGFSVLAAREMERESKNERGGRRRGRKEGNACRQTLYPLFTHTIFHAFLALQNCMETLAWQAIFHAMINL